MSVRQGFLSSLEIQQTQEAECVSGELLEAHLTTEREGFLSQGTCASRIRLREIACACQAHLGDQHPLLITERFVEYQRFLRLRDRTGIRSLVGVYPYKANECLSTTMLVSHLAE